MQTFLVTATSSDGQSTTQSVSYTVTPAAPTLASTSLEAMAQVVLPRFGGIGLFHVSATLTSSGTGVAGQGVMFTAGHTRLCTATTSKVGVAGCTLSFAQEAAVLRSNASTATYTATSGYAGSMSTIPAVVYCNGWGAWHPNSLAAHRVDAHARHQTARHELTRVHGAHARRIAVEIHRILHHR
jgi:hypothetical protein